MTLSLIQTSSFPQLHTHEVVEVCAKILYQVELQRSTLEQMWGFSVEAELIENADRQDELCCYVSRVEDKSVALQNGKHTGTKANKTVLAEFLNWKMCFHPFPTPPNPEQVL